MSELQKLDLVLFYSLSYIFDLVSIFEPKIRV